MASTRQSETDVAVLFDVDGVLVDSYEAHFQSWRGTARELGFEFTRDDFQRAFGRIAAEMIAEDWTKRVSGLTPARILEVEARKESLYRDVVREKFPAMDGARELIESLAKAGFRVAIGSSGPPENVELAVEKLGIAPFLAGRVTGVDVTRGKPDPQVFLLAAERAGVPPERCLVVEDAMVGIRAAHAAGMKCVGVVSDGHTHEELHEADARVDSLRELSPERIRSMILGSESK